MDKLIKKLDELFEKYGVTEEEIAEVGEIIAEVAGGELNSDAEDFEAPDMGDGEDGYENEEGAED